DRATGAQPASQSPGGRRSAGSGARSPEGGRSSGRLAVQMPEARLPPFLRGRVIRLQQQGPIVRIEGFAVPLQLLEGDPFAGPRIRAPIVLRDRLLVPQSGNLGIAAFEGEFGELQQDPRSLLIRLARVDEGLKVRTGGAQRWRR